MNKKFQILLEKIKKVISQSLEKDEKLQNICTILRDSIEYYNWVGCYIFDKSKNELILGTYSGASTEHTNIRVGKGICGQVAESKKTQIIQDVSKENNYLSCSIYVKSEIVVPIMKDGDLIAELDIDSHVQSPFTNDDKEFLESVCLMINNLFE